MKILLLMLLLSSNVMAAGLSDLIVDGTPVYDINVESERNQIIEQQAIQDELIDADSINLKIDALSKKVDNI